MSFKNSYRLRILLFSILPLLFFACSDNDSPALAVRGTYKGTLSYSDQEKTNDIIMSVKATEDDVIYCEFETDINAPSSLRIKVAWEEGKVIIVGEKPEDNYKLFSYDPSSKTINLTIAMTAGIYHYTGTKTK